MNKISLSDAAKYADISRTQARYWTKLLNIKLIKIDRTLFIASGSEKLLETMNNIVKSGMSPALSAKEVLSVHTLPVIQDQKAISNSDLTDRISSLEQAVMLLVEQNKALATTTETQSKRIEEQNKFIVSTLQTQSNHLKKIQLELNPPPKQKQVEVWKPTEPQRPKYSTIQRIWYEVTNPEKLRAN